jgi:hypothetical protein
MVLVQFRGNRQAGEADKREQAKLSTEGEKNEATALWAMQEDHPFSLSLFLDIYRKIKVLDGFIGFL